jgi:hypothetical protein
MPLCTLSLRRPKGLQLRNGAQDFLGSFHRVEHHGGPRAAALVGTFRHHPLRFHRLVDRLPQRMVRLRLDSLHFIPNLKQSVGAGKDF